MIIDELIAILGYDVKGEDDLRRFNDGLDRAEKGAQAVVGRISAVSVAVGTFVGNLAAQGAMRLGSVIGSLPGDVLGVGRKFEAYEIQLSALEGSKERAKAALDWIDDFAKRTPLELDGVVSAYVQMRTFGLEPTNGSLQTMVDTMAMTGKGQEQLQGIILAVGQAWTAQKLQGQDAMQLMQRGVPVWDILSKAMGKSVDEVQKLSKAGKLGRTEIQLLIDEMGKRAAGASDEFAKSFDGITSNISDMWTGFLKKISEKGYYDEIKRRLNGVKETIERWDKDGTLDKAATAISKIMTVAINAGSRVGSYLFTIGKGAFYAADGIVSLVSRVTGLDRTLSAGILGAAAVGSTATGRAATVALAKRVPWVAALLAIDELISTAQGADTMISKWAGRENVDKLNASLRDLLGNLKKWVGFKVPENNSVTEAMESQMNAAQKLVEAFQMAVDGLNRLFGASRSDEIAAPVGPEIYGPGDDFDPSRLGRGQGGWITDRKREPIRFADDALDYKLLLQNLEGNLAKQSDTNAAAATINDNKQDNRDQSVTTTVNVGGVTVQQATQAPGAVGQAVGNAAAAASRPSRFEMGPAF